MNFIATEKLDRVELEAFFEEKWATIDDKDTLHRDGFFVEDEGQYKAYFALSPVDKQAYWLKSLYMKEGVPATYPLTIIESSIALAREKGGTDLYVFSHQSSLNSLLGLLQFKEQKNPPIAVENEWQGSWWKVALTKEIQPNCG